MRQVIAAPKFGICFGECPSGLGASLDSFIRRASNPSSTAASTAENDLARLAGGVLYHLRKHAR
jgi:hypothetical protein